MMNASTSPPTKAIILAAGVGSRIRPLTNDCPKSLLKVAGLPILERMIVNILECGISEFIFVLGYREEQIREFVRSRFPELKATYVVNELYRRTNTGYSLMLAQGAADGAGFVKFDADVVFDPDILKRLIDNPAENALCIDRNIKLDAEEVKVVVDDDMLVRRASKSIDPKSALGESIGIEKIGAATAVLLFAELVEMMANESQHKKYYEAAYERLIIKRVAFHAVDITGLDWIEIDTLDDFDAANRIAGFEAPVLQSI